MCRTLMILAALLPCLHAEEPTNTRLANVAPTMRKFVEKDVVAGVVTVVGTSRGITRLDAVGKLTLDPEKSMPKDALFRIASMTKPITAVGIMILAEQGKLDVRDPVEKHLPEFRGQMLLAERGKDTLTLKRPRRAITIKDLLTHTSGLPFYPPGLGDLYVRRNRSLAESILAVSQRPLEFEPGSRWAYCNSGIDTLGRIIEVKSGQPYEEFLEQRIFAPLGMKDTTFYPNKTQLSRLAGLYELSDGKLVPAKRPIIGLGSNPRHPIPAGGLFSTAPDVARFYQMMLAGGTFGEHRILSSQSVQEMTRVQTGNLKTGFTPGMGFGYGFAVVREPQGVTAMLSPGSYGHGGAFGTQSWADPKKDLFLILMIQRVGLPNADGSDLRREFQQVAVDALGR